MRTARSLAAGLALCLALGPFARADEDPTEIVDDLLSGDPKLVRAAENELDVGSPEFLRSVIRVLRRRIGSEESAPMFAPAPPPPPAPAPPPDPRTLRPPRVETAKGDGESYLVTIATTFLETDAEIPRAFGLLGPRGELVRHALSPEESAKILTAVEKRRGAKVLTAPSITVQDRQHANVSMLNEVSYLQDYDERRVDGYVVRDPVLGVVQDGMALELTPAVTPDRTQVLLDIRVKVAELQIPMGRFSTIVEGSELVVQLPVVNEIIHQQRVAVSKGRRVLVDAMRRSGEDTWLLVLVEIVDVVPGTAADLVPSNFTPPDEDSVPPPGPAPAPPPSPPIPPVK